MAMTQDRPTRARGFVSTSPATGEVVGSFPLDGAEQVAAAVARAREAQRGWAELGFDGRRRALQAYTRRCWSAAPTSWSPWSTARTASPTTTPSSRSC